MIAVTAAPLVPDWVHDGYFPQADEEQLAALGDIWKTQGDQAQQHSDDLDRRVRTLMSSYSGDAADAASAHVTKVRKFLDSTGAACHSLAECCAKAAQLVTFAKTSINVVILALQVQSQKLTGSQESSGNLVTKVVTVVKLRQLQIAAQAKIKAIHDAVEKRIAALSPEVDIQPALTIPAGTTSSFAPGTPTTLFTKSKVSQVAGDHGIPLTREGNGTEGTGLPGAPNAGPRDGTNPDGTGPGSPGEDGTGEDGTESGLDLTDPTSLFDDPGSAVGADNDQGPEPDGEDSEDNTSISDAVFSDEEQSALEDEVNQQIDDGTSTIDFDGQDLTDDASSIDESEIPDSFPDKGPTTPSGSGPDGSMSIDGDTGDDGAAGMHTDAGGGSSDARPADSGGSSAANVNVEIDSDSGGGGGGTYDVAPSTGSGSGSAGGSYSYGTDTGSSGGGGTSSAAPSGGNHGTGSGYDYGGGGSGSGGIDTGSGSGSGGSSGGPGSSGPDRDPGTSAAGYVPPAQVPGDLATPGSGGSGGGLTGGTSGLPGPSGGPSSGAPSGLGSGGGAAPPPPPAPGGGIVGAPAAPPATAAPAPAPSLGGSAATTPHPTAPAQPAPPANVTAQAAQTVSQQQPAAPAQAKQVPPGAPAAQPPDRGVREPSAAVPNRDGIPTGVAAAAMPLGLAGLAPLFRDLRQRVPAPQELASALSLLPTQFGPDDVPLAALPPGWGVPYQKVLLPGEADAYLAGQVTTIRGLLHPYEQVSGLNTPGELQQMLGLGFAIANGQGGTELAFDPNTDGIEVMRFAGVPGGDLVIPVSEGTDPGTGSSIRALVRHHRRPWGGGGIAPGSSEDLIVEEFEVLPELGLPVPHLAEIWRVNADGTSEHLGTHNARTGLWRRSTVSAPPAGTPLPHGPVAVMPDGARFATVVLNDHEHVLVDRTGHAPDFFTDAPDGTHRHVVASDQISAVVGVATMGTWRGARVLVLQQAGDHLLVDFIGDDPEQAEALGLRQLGQGQWQQTWVPAVDVSGARTWERSYPPPGVTPSRPVAPAPSTAAAG